MDLSRLRSRRGVLAMALAAALSRVMPAKAQWTTGCEYGITNGLLTIGGDDCGIAVPSHMIDGTGNSLDDDATGTVGTFNDTRNEDRQDRLFDRRDQKRDKRSRRTNKKQDQKDRRHERKILCEDFSSQLQAVEAMAQNPWAAKMLDPDGDGIPCEDLRALTCDEFGDEAEAVNWFNRMGYTKDYDPFKLFDKETDSVCTYRAICDDFNSQKEAVEWITHHPRDKQRLDQGNKKMPCPDLPTVTCKSFNNSIEATNWFNQNGFAPNDDPYKLWDDETGTACPSKVTCASFTDQKEAVEWMGQNGDPKERLDPNKDGIPCEDLEPVTCSQLYDEEGDVEGVTAWFNLYFTENNDPYHLYDTVKQEVCPANG